MAYQANSQPSSRNNQSRLNNNSEDRISLQFYKNDVDNVLEHNNIRSNRGCSLKFLAANRTLCDVLLVQRSYRRTSVVDIVIKATSTNHFYWKSKQEGKVGGKSITTRSSRNQDTIAGIDTIGKSLPSTYGSHTFSQTETRQTSKCGSHTKLYRRRLTFWSQKLSKVFFIHKFSRWIWSITLTQAWSSPCS